MTLEEIYYIGQTIAVLAILGSLAAIYWQQRKAHALARAESQREISQLASQWFDEVLAHPTGLENVAHRRQLPCETCHAASHAYHHPGWSGVLG